MVGEKKLGIFHVCVYLIAGVVTFLFLLPLLYIIANAFSDPIEVYSGSVGIIPKGFTLSNIIEVFKSDEVMKGAGNTILYTVIGTMLQLFLEFSIAYPLSRRDLKGKGFVSIFLTLPMFISGGMIPTYLVVKQLGMLNTMWSLIIPGCLGIYKVIIIRTYITSSIPYELTESATMDGGNVLQCFYHIILPLSKPIICVMALYAIVGSWNSYFNSLLYTTDERLWPLQRVLQRILISNVSSGLGTADSLMRAEGMKYAIILVSSAPLLILYPFFQKYFEKGIMVGSIKG